jgi:hypothetical protein
MSGYLAQLGVKDEVTYGTAVVVDRFFEFTGEQITAEQGRVESTGLRAGTRTLRADRRVPYQRGAGGSVDLDVLSRGFGWWLKHMLGTVTTTGPAQTTVHTHTGTVGGLAGKSFTAQLGVPQISGTVSPKTATGGKVKSWELSCAAGEPLKFKADLDFQKLDMSTSLATASYLTGMEVITFIKGTVTVGGSAVQVKSFSVTGDNGLKTDRYHLGIDGYKKESIENALREFNVALELDFENLDHQNRILAMTASGTQAAVTLVCEGLGTIGTSLKPSVTITLPVVMFDGDTPVVGGPDLVTQSLKGRILGPADGTTSPITIAYQSTDTTA